MCGMISRYPSMIKTLERSVRIALAHRGETRDPWCESFSTNRDSRDGYLWTMYEWKFWPSSWSTHPPISMWRKWTQYFRGEENRHSRFPSASSSNPLGEWNRTRRNSVATSPIEQRASLLLEWRGLEAVAFFETAGGKERNDRKRWAAREGGEEKKEREKKRKGTRLDHFLGEEREKETLKRRESRPLSHGNTAVATEYRSIAFFAAGRSKPTFLTFALHYLSIVPPSASNHRQWKLRTILKGVSQSAVIYSPAKTYLFKLVRTRFPLA